MSPNEKRRMRDQKRRATKKAAEESWRARVDAHFGFLREQYGFQISRIYRKGPESPVIQGGYEWPTVLDEPLF
jgi:hypothetical protein